MRLHLLISVTLSMFWTSFTLNADSNTDTPIVRIATFNVSMEATNYITRNKSPKGDELSSSLNSNNHPQIKNIAQIIQHVRPDIILLNEFDYTSQSTEDLKMFVERYLNVPQSYDKKGQQLVTQGIDYPYRYAAPSNTGVDSGIDLDGDGEATGMRGDAYGFGLFPGHYGMAVLSKYPIDDKNVRTFQKFLWKDMPNNLLDDILNEDGSEFYSQAAKAIFRLSSKSHWDVPIKVGEHTLHLFASHPTPPVFDGFEDRNGKRNHDEIRFWTDYISGSSQSAYIYDDKGTQAGFTGQYFIIAGDLNSSPHEGSSIKQGISELLAHPRVNQNNTPVSAGGNQHSPDNIHSTSHTAAWRSRVDYALPSASLTLVNSGVFWPEVDDPLHRLVADRSTSSDHRLVWIDVATGATKSKHNL